MKVIEGLFYTKEHEWVKVDGDVAYIGITDYAQHKMGDIVFVELPDEDDELIVGDSLCVIESVKAASEVYTPLSGTVSEVNRDLEDEPEALNNDPYDNWIASITDYNQDEIDELLSAEEYTEFVEGLDD